MCGDDGCQKLAAELEEFADTLNGKFRLLSQQYPARTGQIAATIHAISSVYARGPALAPPLAPTNGGDGDKTGKAASASPAGPPISKQMIEYATLKFVDVRNGERVNKREIFDELCRLGLIDDNLSAFSTRLSNLRRTSKQAGYLEWADNKQMPHITINDSGKTRCAQLTSGGNNALTKQELAWFEDHAPWARKDRPGAAPPPA